MNRIYSHFYPAACLSSYTARVTVYCCALILLSLLPGAPVAAQQTASAPALQTLEAGSPIEREMRGGQSHSYKIALTEKQYIRVIVEQKGVDVVVKMIAPDEKIFIESNRGKTTQSGEMILLITETAG